MITLDDLNALVNHPDIAPHVAPGYCELDLRAFYERPDSLIVGDVFGVIIMAPLAEDGLYGWHWLLTPMIRGAGALRLGREALKAAFTTPGVRAICGATPREFRAARLMNRALGARPIGESIDAYGRPCINYLLERETWAKSLAGLLAASVH